MRICSFIWGVGITRRAERVSLVDGLTTCMRWADASFLCGRLGLAGNAVASLCVCMRHVHGRVACFWVVYADVQFNCMCARASWLEIGESTCFDWVSDWAQRCGTWAGVQLFPPLKCVLVIFACRRLYVL